MKEVVNRMCTKKEFCEFKRIASAFPYNSLRKSYKKKSKITCSFFKFIEFIRDLDRIQTCNLLSRNQMRYSVAPRGLFEGANIGIFD